MPIPNNFNGLNEDQVQSCASHGIFNGCQENIAKGLLMYDKLDLARISSHSSPSLAKDIEGSLDIAGCSDSFDQRRFFGRPSGNSEKGMPIRWLGASVGGC